MSEAGHEATATQERVDPDEYTEEYYLSDCEGFDHFRATGGRKPSPRLAQALKLAAVKRGQRVLDVGCGRGELVLGAAERGAQIIGIDYADAATRIAGRTIGRGASRNGGRAAVARMDATRLALPSETFDTILMVDFVEHLYPKQLEEAFDEAYRVLKPSGRLIVHTAPNKLFSDLVWPYYVRHIHRGLLAVARRFKLQGRLLNPMMLPTMRELHHSHSDERFHVNEQTPKQLTTLLKARGFRSLKLDFREPPPPPIYDSWRVNMEVKLLDIIRFWRPFSWYWPLNRLFSNHIWIIARRPAARARR